MIRVLIVDDSPLVRRFLRAAFTAEPDFEVVGEAADPIEARTLITLHRPDVLTLDMEMPRMDGLTFLNTVVRGEPVRVVVLSSLTARGSEIALAALAAGAVEVLQKPSSRDDLPRLRVAVVDAARVAAAARLREAPPRVERLPHLASPRRSLVAIGASTGGTTIIDQLLGQFPANMPPVVVVQHMPEGFTAAFARRLATRCALDVREAVDGDALLPGVALIAPGGRHLLVQQDGGKLVANVREGPRVSGHAPSVDVLFRSVARAAGPSSVAVILTGMGRDGARGMLELRQAGGITLAQDEESCVVYGMPMAAVEDGAVLETVELAHLASRVVEHVRGTTGMVRSGRSRITAP
jgi:two-component system chemotaxis response regulator CheB